MATTTTTSPPPAHGDRNIHVTRLSELWGAESWRARANQWGERPEVDFAYSTPFRFFSEAALAGMNAAVDEALAAGRLCQTERSTFLRGVEALEPFLDLDRLAELCSRLAGVALVPHALRREWTHVNVQLEPQDRPVDKFHVDYVPFVFVTMLRKAPDDDTGKLVLRASPSSSSKAMDPDAGDVAVSLQAGESILLQGSHVCHQANQSALSCRVSLVVSLMPASVLLTDMTRIRYHSLPLAEGEAYFRNAMAYREARIRTLAREHPERKDRLLDEFTRWLRQLDANEEGVDPEVVALFAKAYAASDDV